MDELCNTMGNLIPVHDPGKEYTDLIYSISLGVEKLSNSKFLDKTFYRYERYLKYLNISIVLYYKIHNFISYKNKNYDRLLLASECIKIDSLILSEYENLDSDFSE